MQGSQSRTGTILVIGVGNACACDDAAGLAAAQRLDERLEESFRVVRQSGEGTALMECWKGADAVILIDAARSEAIPGTLHRFDASATPLPAWTLRRSSHSFSVCEAIELSRALGQLPRRVIVYGIEGRDFRSGLGLSPAVQEAVDKAADAVLEEVQTLLSAAGC